MLGSVWLVVCSDTFTKLLGSGDLEHKSTIQVAVSDVDLAPILAKICLLSHFSGKSTSVIHIPIVSHQSWSDVWQMYTLNKLAISLFLRHSQSLVCQTNNNGLSFIFLLQKLTFISLSKICVSSPSELPVTLHRTSMYVHRSCTYFNQCITQWVRFDCTSM